MATKTQRAINSQMDDLGIDTTSDYYDMGYGTDDTPTPKTLQEIEDENAAVTKEIIQSKQDAGKKTYGLGTSREGMQKILQATEEDWKNPVTRAKLIGKPMTNENIEGFLENFTNTFPDDKLAINWFLTDGWKEIKGLGKTAAHSLSDLITGMGYQGTKLAIQGWYASRSRNFWGPKLGNAITSGVNWGFEQLGARPDFLGYWDDTPSPIVLEGKDGKPMTDDKGQLLTWTPEQASDHWDNQRGWRRRVSEFNDMITGGVRMPEGTRDWLDRSVYGFVQFWGPVIPGVPLEKTFKIATKLFKGMDAKNMDTAFYKWLKDEGYSEDVAKYLEIQYRSQLKTGKVLPKALPGKFQNIRGVAQGESKFSFKDRTGNDITFNYEHRFNVKRDQRSWEIFSNLNRGIGAGITYGISDSYLRAVYPDTYKEKQWIPLIFGMAGYMKGVRPLIKTAARTPGALIPFMPGTTFLSGLPPTLVTRWGIYLPFKLVGTVLQVQNRRWGSAGKSLHKGEAFDTVDASLKMADRWNKSNVGRFAQYIAVGGNIDTAIASLTKASFGKKVNWDELIVDQKMDKKALLAMAKSIRQLPAEERRNLEYASHQFLELMENLNKESGTAGINDMLVSLEQLFGTAHLQSLKAMNVDNMKFGKGWLRKSGVFGTWWNKRSFLSELDNMENAIAQQTNQIATRIKALQNNPESVAGREHRVIEFLQEQLLKQQRLTDDFGRQRARLAGEIKGYEDVYEIMRIKALIGETREEGGFLSTKYARSWDLSETNTKVSPSQSDNISTIKREAFDVDTAEQFDDVNSILWSVNNRIYQKSAIDTNEFMPIPALVNRVDEAVLSDNVIVRDYIAGSGRTVNKENFVQMAKENFFTGAAKHFEDPAKRGDLIDHIVKQMENPKGGFNIRIGADAKAAYLTIPEVMAFKSLKLEDFVKEVSAIRGGEENTIRILNDLMPPVVPIKIAEQVKRGAYTLYNKLSRGTNKNDVREDIVGIENAFSTDLSSITRAQLEAMDIDPARIEGIIKARKAADKSFRENIGETINTYQGRKLFENAEDSSGPLTSAERWTNFIFNNATYTAKGPLQGKWIPLNMFEKMFPKQVMVDGKWVTKLEVPVRGPDGSVSSKTIDLAEHRAGALEKIQHSIGEMIIDGDIEAFINKIPAVRMKQLEQAGILTKSQYETLSGYQAAIRKVQHSNMPPEVRKSLENLNDALNSLEATVKGRIDDNFIKQWVGDKTTTNAEKMMDSLFMHGAKGPRASTKELFPDIETVEDALDVIVQHQKQYGKMATGRQLKKILDDGTKTSDEIDTEIQYLLSGRTSDTLPNPRLFEVAELVKGFDRQAVENITDNPITLILRELKDSPGRIDDVEDMVLYTMLQRSFRYTDRKTPITIDESGLPYNQLDDMETIFEQNFPVGEGAVAGTLGLRPGLKVSTQVKQMMRNGRFATGSLKPELDILALKENMEKAIPMIYSIAVFRRQHGMMDANAFNAAETKIAKLMDLFQVGTMVGGKIRTLLLKEVPMGLSRKQQGGRLYNWARGFVHPGYLGVEATMMNLQIGQARFLRDVLMDPHAVDIFHKAIVDNGQLTWSQMKYIARATLKAFRGMGAAQEFDKREFTQDQKDEMIRDFYIQNTGQFPPDYLRHLKREWDAGNGRPAIGGTFPGLGSLVVLQQQGRKQASPTLYGGGEGTAQEARYMYPGAEEWLAEEQKKYQILPTDMHNLEGLTKLKPLSSKRGQNPAGQRLQPKITLDQILNFNFD